MDEPNNPITPHPTTPPTNPPQPDTPPSHRSTTIPTSTQTQSHAQTVASHTTIPTNNPSQTVSIHPMVTRAKAVIFKPLERMNCHVTTTSPLPHSHVHALRDLNWKESMLDGYNALITNGTWVLVPHPANVNVVRSMWIFKHKFHADGSLSRYKARLVANRHSQQQGIDYDETFSLVIKPATICTVLSLVISCDWPIHQLDAKNAFLHGHLSETVYMHQPPGFVDSCHPDYVCHLQRSLYGLKQAPRAWFQRFASFVTRIALLQHIIALLHSEFAMTDLGSHNYFLDADWASCLVTHRSTFGAKAEYRDVANVVTETAWIREVRVLHVPSRFKYADIFTKGLTATLFLEFHSSLNVRRPPVSTAGEY
nr:ribonuclease H-like domain-containing protein [Tanacetum cinerariifolium]